MNIKKIAKSMSAVAIALVVGVSLASCGAKDGAQGYLEKELQNSQETIQEIAKELKDGKTEKAAKIPGVSQVVSAFGGDVKVVKAIGEFTAKMGEFEFEVKDVKESGDSATAKVVIKTYNFKEILTKATTELQGEVEKIVGEISSQQEAQKAIIIKMFNYVTANAKDKNFEKTIEVKLEKKDKKWAVTTESLLDISNATTGGMN